MNQRGVSLGTTILVVLIMVVLVFALAGSTVGHLNLSTRQENSERARDLALSAVSKALATLMEDEGFTGTVEHRNADGVGLVTFDANRGVGWSTNNLDGSDSESGYNGQLVPKYAVHLVGTGRCGGAERVVEAVLAVPPFPYAIACSGLVHSPAGGLTIGSLDPDAWDGGRPSFDRHDLLPGDLLSNGDGDEAVVLGPDSFVKGDLQSVGGIVLDAGASVGGEIRPFSAVEEIPRIRPEDFDPVSKPDLQELSPSVDYSGAVLSGYARYTGDLEVNDGLNLLGALLYVDGNLTVNGGLRGQGAVIVTGATSLSGGVSELTADGQVALISAGDVSINGGGVDTDFFRGLVYTEGSLSATGMTLVGALIARHPDGSNSAFLDNVRVISDPSLGDIEVRWSVNSNGTVNLGWDFNSAGAGAAGSFPSYYDSVPVSFGPNGSVSTGGQNFDSYDELISHLESSTGQYFTGDLERMMRNSLAQANAALNAGANGPQNQALVTILPSDFYQTSDKMRVVLWRGL